MYNLWLQRTDVSRDTLRPPIISSQNKAIRATAELVAALDLERPLE